MLVAQSRNDGTRDGGLPYLLLQVRNDETKGTCAHDDGGKNVHIRNDEVKKFKRYCIFYNNIYLSKVS